MHDALTIEDIGDDEWWRFVRTRSEATPFHHPAWSRLIAECYRYPAFAIAVRDPEGAIIGGLPVVEVRHRPARPRWVCLPFSDHCGVLGLDATAGLPQALDRLRAGHGVRRLEIRGALDGPNVVDSGARSHVLRLTPDQDEVFARLHKNQVQRNIKRAQREGVTVRITTAERDLVDVFFGLHLRTRRRLGVPVQPRRYFRLLWRRVVSQGLGLVLVASLDDVPVAAAVFLTFNGTMVYKYGASDAAAWAARPNHLLFWDAIRWACDHGYDRFDFGRTDAGDESLRLFKSRWGTVERPLLHTVLGAPPGVAATGTVPPRVRSVISRSPLIVNRALGNLLYRRAA